MLVVASDGTAATTAGSPDDPRAVVSSFYDLVARHRFDAAAQLWSPHMQAAFPTDENLNQRFSQTDAVRIERLDVLSQNETRATVAVDVVESHRQAGQRRFVGNWYLVRGANGWMLDQPELRSAP